LFLTGPRDSGSDPGRAAQLFGTFLLSLGASFYCIEITSEKMRGWLRLAGSILPDIGLASSVIGRNISFEQLEALAAVEAEDMIRKGGFLHIHGGLRVGRFRRSLTDHRKRLVNVAD
jgi:hypothetical protein